MFLWVILNQKWAAVRGYVLRASFLGMCKKYKQRSLKDAKRDRAPASHRYNQRHDNTLIFFSPSTPHSLLPGIFPLKTIHTEVSSSPAYRGNCKQEQCLYASIYDRT